MVVTNAVCSRQKSSSDIYDDAAKKIKSLVLEELASINPFPTIEAGVVKGVESQYLNSEKVSGIILKNTLGPQGAALSCARITVLRPDGAYIYMGVCAKKDASIGWWNIHEKATIRANSSYEPVFDDYYLLHCKEIFEAISKARGK